MEIITIISQFLIELKNVAGDNTDYSTVLIATALGLGVGYVVGTRSTIKTSGYILAAEKESKDLIIAHLAQQVETLSVRLQVCEERYTRFVETTSFKGGFK